MAPVTPKKPSPAVGGDEPTELTGPIPDLDRDDTVQTVIPPLPTSVEALQQGEMLGEYRVDRMIGRGGMGTVYSVVHPVIGKRAAAKVLKRELCADPYTVERFLDEARVVNEIGHPNIVDIFAFGEMADGRHYFVMEYLRGESLHARLQRPLPLGEVSTILRQLVRALEAAHAKGIIHRDLKPENIFLSSATDEPVRVKLLDFGIAKLVRDERRIEKTATGAMVGTPLYIAPEQAKGHAIDASADIYALGGITFELLTGRPPFVADNAMEIVAKHLMEPPPRPSQIATVPRALDDLVHRMLAKDALTRPSLREVIAVLDGAASWSVDLTAITAGDASLSMLPTRPHTPIPVRAGANASKRVALVIAGMLVACAATFVIVTIVTDDKPSIPTVKAPPPLAEARVAAPPSDPAPPVETKAPDPTPAVVVPVVPSIDVKLPDTDNKVLPHAIVKQQEPKPVVAKQEVPRPPPIVKTVEPVKKSAPDPFEQPTGHLVVSVTNNDHWTVAVDGVDRGHAIELVLPAGHHKIELRLANEPSRAFEVDITDGGSRTVHYVSPLGDLIGPGSTTKKTPTP